jgi:two-component system cell cycle response regulator DivK
MSFRIASEQLAALVHDAQVLTERTSEQECQLEELVAASERDVCHAESSLSASVANLTAGEFRRQLLSAQIERSAAGAAAARRLLVGAHLQHEAARRLLAHLGGDHDTAGHNQSAVLVVDDYRSVRELVARVLQNAGFVVRTAANGLEGLLAAHQIRPGVIVMDISMPVLDGIEATRLIKADEASRNARVIAFTGNHAFDDGETQSLFDAVLAKPATPGALLETVQRVASLPAL